MTSFLNTGPSMKFDKIHSKERGLSRGLICIRFDNLTKFEHFWICQISETANKNDSRDSFLVRRFDILTKFEPFINWSFPWISLCFLSYNSRIKNIFTRQLITYESKTRKSELWVIPYDWSIRFTFFFTFTFKSFNIIS